MFTLCCVGIHDGACTFPAHLAVVGSFDITDNDEVLLRWWGLWVIVDEEPVNRLGAVSFETLGLVGLVSRSHGICCCHV